MVKPTFIPSLMPGMGANKLTAQMSAQRPLHLRQTTTDTLAKAQEQGGSGKKKTRTRRAKRDNTNNLYINPTFGGGEESSSSSSSDSFAREVKRTLFYDDNRTEPIRFDMDIKDTTCLMPLAAIETNGDTVGVDDTRFMVNIANFTRANDGGVNSTSDYPVYNHYKILYSQMSKRVMATIKSKIVDDFTFAHFYDYMQLISTALEVYYTTDAILSYTSRTDDKNTGVIDLQRKLTEADLFTSQNELRRALKGHWFPEKFSQLIRWTYQVYKTSEGDQACNYMFLPSKDWLYMTSTEDVASDVKSLIDTTVSNLTVGSAAAIESKIASILGQSYPEGVIRGLPISTNAASYDSQHYEIFVNQPCLFEVSGTQTVYPFIASDGNIVYARSCNPNEKSGMPFCLQNINQAETGGGQGTIDFFRCVTGGEIGNNLSNKFTMRKSTSGVNFTPRHYTRITNESADVHVIDMETSGTINNKLSAPKSGYQRVYFDNKMAPLINLRNMMDDLYDFVD